MNVPALSCLVVDDEPLAAERLAGLIAAMPDCRVAGIAGNAGEAYALIGTLRPDLVLLDITMPGESGLELAQRLQAIAHPPLVVFCTAYDAHALKAFEAQAIDYLLKPVRAERLADSIERARRLKAALAVGADNSSAFAAWPTESTGCPIRKRGNRRAAESTR